MISLSFLCFCITGSCYGCCEHYIKRGRDWHCAQAQSSFGQHILFYYFIDNCILCSQALNILTAASPYLFPNFLFPCVFPNFLFPCVFPNFLFPCVFPNFLFPCAFPNFLFPCAFPNFLFLLTFLIMFMFL